MSYGNNLGVHQPRNEKKIFGIHTQWYVFQSQKKNKVTLFREQFLHLEMMALSELSQPQKHECVSSHLWVLILWIYDIRWYPTCTDDMEVEVNKSGEEREPVGREKRNVGDICGNMFEVHKYFH